jgi:hypothetical protein
MKTAPDESPPHLRATVKWGLALACGASAVALLWPTPSVVGIREATDAPHVAGQLPVSQAPRIATSQPPGKPVALANALPLSEAPVASPVTAFDPFAGVVLVPPTPPTVAAVAAVAAPVAPSLAPPPQEYRFLGRMTGPDGTQQILLGRGDAVVSVNQGMVLDNGYQVEAITADAVALVFPSSGVRTSIPLPAE